MDKLLGPMRDMEIGICQSKYLFVYYVNVIYAKYLVVRNYGQELWMSLVNTAVHLKYLLDDTAGDV